MIEITLDIVKNTLKKRVNDSNKGDYGRLCCICGSKKFPGAAIMSSKAALKCGVGLIDMVIPKSIYNVVAPLLIEPIFTVCKENKVGTLSFSDKVNIFDSLEKSSSCLLGCGMGNNVDTSLIVFEIISNYKNPILLDADGINVISQNIDILKAAKSSIILTPHPGEMARLLQCDVSFVKENRISCAKKFAKEHNVILVLKGYETIISDPAGNIFKNITGNPGMARAGMGDVLSGMIASFLAQGKDPLTATLSGVYLHGLAGDICKKQFSEISMSTINLIDTLPLLFSKL